MKELYLQFSENEKEVSHLSIYECGEEHCIPQKLPETGLRDRYSIHYVTHGEGYIEFGSPEKQKVRLKRGNIFVIFEREDITYYPDSHNPWSYLWCTLTGSGIDDILNDCGFTRACPYLKIDEFDKVGSIMRELNDSYYESTGNYVCMANLLKLFDLLIRNKNWIHVDSSSQQKGKLFQKLRRYIRDNYRLPLTLEMVANNCFISTSYIKALFQQFSPYSPIEYMHICRIDKACSLLYKKQDIEIGEVAKLIGYTDPLYFSRVFKKIVGESPSEYRDKHELKIIDVSEPKNKQ